jgi:ABC-type sugar transport system substrate-binding protein
VTCGLALGALVLAGCSSSKSSSSKSSAGGGGASTPAAAGSGGGNDVQAKAQEFLKPFLTRPTQIPITTPLSKKPPTGKTIDWLSAPRPDSEGFLPFAKAAAKELGWKLNVINEGNTPATIKAAWQKAVKDKPDGIYDAGNDRSIFATELAQAKAANIPFVQLGSVEPPGNGVTATVESDAPFTLEGQLIANWMVAQQGSDLKALDVQISGFAAVTLTTDTFNKTVTQICSSCSVDKLNFNVSQLGTPAIPNAVVAYLKSHQDINAVFSPFPAVIAGLAPQLSTAGIKDVKLITGGEVDIYNPLKSGVVTAAVYRQDPEWVYTVFDAFARIFVGDSTAPDEQTASNTLMWVVDKSTVPDEASKDIYFPLVTDFEQQFYKLWKLQ